MGQTLIPMSASPVPPRGAQEPRACVGQSRSVVQMMALVAPWHTSGWQATAWAAYSMQQTAPPSQSVGMVQLGVTGGGFSHWSGPKSSTATQLKYGAILCAQQTFGAGRRPPPFRT